MHLPSLVFSGLALLGASTAALAQATPAPQPTPRFYVGVGAYSSYYQQLGRRPLSSTGLVVPVQLTAGYQLRPRLAVQVGLAYSGTTYNYGYEGTLYSYNGAGIQPYYARYRSTVTSRHTSVSALARYTLTRKLAHRVQFDALGGVGLEYGSGYSRGSQADSLSGSFQSTDFAYRDSQTALLLTLGLSTRYRIAPRFDLTLDYTLNYSLPASGRTYQLQGVTGAAALGVRYRFGK